MISEKKVRQKSVVNRIISVILIIIFVLLACYGFIYVKHITESSLKIMLFLDDEKIGYIDDTDTIFTVMTDLTNDIYASTGIVYRFDGKLSYKIDNSNNPVKYTGEDELYKIFMERSSYNFVKAYALYISDKFVAACENKDDIMSVLQRLEQEETDRVLSASIVSAAIFNNVKVTERICFINDIIQPIQLFKKLISLMDNNHNIIIPGSEIVPAKQPVEKTNQIQYTNPDQNNENTVVSDHTASVSNAMTEIIPETDADDIETEALMTDQIDNPDNERVIIRSGGISDELINYSIDYGIPHVRSVIKHKDETDDIILKFKYIKYETVTEITKRKTVYHYSKYLFKDFEKKLYAGSEGLNLTTYKLEYVGDEVNSRQVVSSRILQKSIDRVFIKGIKEYPEAGITLDNYIWPLALTEEPVITSDFGERRPEYDGDSYHFGIDIQIDEGTDIYASNGGTVSYVNRTNSYGIMIIIDHAGGVQTCYPHLSEVFVEIGDKVYQGQKIALSGNSGVSTAPHLHFEVRLDTIPADPYNYLHEKPWK